MNQDLKKKGKMFSVTKSRNHPNEEKRGICDDKKGKQMKKK